MAGLAVGGSGAGASVEHRISGKGGVRRRHGGRVLSVGSESAVLATGATELHIDEHGVALVWTCDRIRADNLLFRSNADFAELYMPFGSLLFFADSGGGDQFALPILLGADRPDVFVWDHESDSRTWVANHLRAYRERRLSGTLEM